MISDYDRLYAEMLRGRGDDPGRRPASCPGRSTPAATCGRSTCCGRWPAACRSGSWRRRRAGQEAAVATPCAARDRRPPGARRPAPRLAGGPAGAGGRGARRAVRPLPAARPARRCGPPCARRPGARPRGSSTSTTSTRWSIGRPCRAALPDRPAQRLLRHRPAGRGGPGPAWRALPAAARRRSWSGSSAAPPARPTSCRRSPRRTGRSSAARGAGRPRRPQRRRLRRVRGDAVRPARPAAARSSTSGPCPGGRTPGRRSSWRPRCSPRVRRTHPEAQSGSWAATRRPRSWPWAPARRGGHGPGAGRPAPASATPASWPSAGGRRGDAAEDPGGLRRRPAGRQHAGRLRGPGGAARASTWSSPPARPFAGAILRRPRR